MSLLQSYFYIIASTFVCSWPPSTQTPLTAFNTTYASTSQTLTKLLTVAGATLLRCPPSTLLPARVGMETLMLAVKSVLASSLDYLRRQTPPSKSLLPQNVRQHSRKDILRMRRVKRGRGSSGVYRQLSEAPLISKQCVPATKIVDTFLLYIARSAYCYKLSK